VSRAVVAPHYQHSWLPEADQLASYTKATQEGSADLTETSPLLSQFQVDQLRNFIARGSLDNIRTKWIQVLTWTPLLLLVVLMRNPATVSVAAADANHIPVVKPHSEIDEF